MCDVVKDRELACVKGSERGGLRESNLKCIA
jgi:hypothetical protein